MEYIVCLIVAASVWLTVEGTCCIFANAHEKTRIVTSSVVSLVCLYMLFDGPKHLPVGWVITMISMSITFRYTRRRIMAHVPGMNGFLLGFMIANLVAMVVFLVGSYLSPPVEYWSNR